MDKKKSLLIKVAISVGVIVVIAWKVDLSLLLEALKQTRISFLLLGFVLYPMAQIICALKWRYLAQALGIKGKLGPMVRLYFIGIFFNLFLPTSIGGDITRGMYLQSSSGKTSLSFLSVFVERATGVLAMLIISSILLISPVGSPLPPWLRYGFPVASLITIIVLWLLPKIIPARFSRIQKIVREDLIIFWKRPEIVGLAVLYSAIFDWMLIVIHILIGHAISIHVPPLYYFITMSLGSLIGILPSLNGIGVRDGSYIYLLGRVSIQKEEAFLFSILWFIVMVGSGVIGYLLYLIKGMQPAVESSSRTG
jgi:uncharacterized membrane protein YbhN (UPF0104 family)